MHDLEPVRETVEILERLIPDPRLGLPEDVFLFVSRLTPLVNVDLLIRDENGRALLSWRDDTYAGTGWHLPGGIIRYRESIESRIQKVIETEIGTKVEFDPTPIAINQIFCTHETRGHFIAFLINCSLSGTFAPKNKGLTKTDAGYLMWHNSYPKNMIPVHEIYKKYF
jgi:ADP-ribose pyrophosphatase YjhB (NUDIX family)